MKNIKKSSIKGFTLIELLIVIAIIGILASIATPAYNGIRESGLRTKDVNNVRQICLGCRVFAADFDGLYPSFDPDEEQTDGEDSTFSDSIEAFNVLIPTYIDLENVFWLQTKDPDRLRAPDENGTLEADECVYGYAVGQTDTSFSNSPLVFDGLMEGPGAFGEFHPWLAKRKAVIGFCDGHVEQLTLTSSEAGATARSKDSSIQDIFEERTAATDDGENSGGFLDTDAGNILLPGGA